MRKIAETNANKKLRIIFLKTFPDLFVHFFHIASEYILYCLKSSQTHAHFSEHFGCLTVPQRFLRSRYTQLCCSGSDVHFALV